jgi:hypothetical protein
VFQRVAEAALRYLGVPPTLNPSPPVIVGRPDRAPQPEAADLTLVSVVAAASDGTVPDVRGLSAREAMRTLAALGLTPRVSGDGFVVSQEPEPGAPLVPNSDSLLTLDRQPDQLATAGVSP